MRTFNNTKIYCLQHNIERLIYSANKLPKRNKQLCLKFENFHKDIIHIIKSSINFAQENIQLNHSTSENPEFQVTIIFNWNPLTSSEKNHELISYIRALPIHRKPIQVHCVYAHRDTPSVKDCNWVKERSKYEQLQDNNTNETLLLDCDGNITEGLSSNFFAIRNGDLYTCGDQFVLQGTIRQKVIDHCQQKGIKMLYQKPNIYGAHFWDSCFICSTTRLVLPIDTLFGPSGEEFTFRKSALLKQLAEMVKENLITNSEDLYSD